MNDWVFILMPLIVLPIVLLFRFVGCTSFSAEEASDTEKPPRYRDYIMAEPNNPGQVKNTTVVPSRADVIAYWRLVEAGTATKAEDQTGLFNGDYKTVGVLPHEAPTQTQAGSEPAGGGFFPGQTGLIASDPSKLCRIFNGGHVFVPFKSGLYTDEFTIEAWIDARWSQLKGYEHTLFDAGGHYRKLLDPSPSFHGFRIFANREDCWQVYLAPGGAVAMTTPQVAHSARTHLAVTVEHDAATGNNNVTLFVNGKVAGLGNAGFYSRPDGAPLFIGVANKTPEPSNPPELRTPVLSLIQEVVLHRKALSQDEIENHFAINR
jgi:hypothetical protein